MIVFITMTTQCGWTPVNRVMMIMIRMRLTVMMMDGDDGDDGLMVMVMWMRVMSTGY